MWRDVRSWDGGQSRSGAVIVKFRNGNRIVRVSPDRFLVKVLTKELLQIGLVYILYRLWLCINNSKAALWQRV